MQGQRDRILAKIDELRGYLNELRQIRAKSFEEYSNSVEKRRSTERLLQISVECVLDISSLFVASLKLGLPSSEEDLLEKVESAALFQPATIQSVKSMRAFRNILVHRYGRVDDQIVFNVLEDKLSEFDTFIEETLSLLRRKTSKQGEA